jgi:hypothetical protein
MEPHVAFGVLEATLQTTRTKAQLLWMLSGRLEVSGTLMEQPPPLGVLLYENISSIS